MTFNDENTYKGIASMYIDFFKKKKTQKMIVRTLPSLFTFPAFLHSLKSFLDPPYVNLHIKNNKQYF